MPTDNESEWTADDQALADFVADVACEISADEDVVHEVIGALIERNLFDRASAIRSIREKYP